MSAEHIHFVTGRLAENALRSTLAGIETELNFEFSVGVMPITVAALMTPAWLARHLDPPAQATKILLPGYCTGDLTPIHERVPLPVEIGPRDLRNLPEYFGSRPVESSYGKYDIEILAEINHAPRLALHEIRERAKAMVADGADLIDLGCEPGHVWRDVDRCVHMLVDDGIRVSIDSLNPREISAATAAGAELVLSVNSSNREAAVDWGCEVVAIPDDPADMATLDDTIDFLANAGIALRIDPILEPIGFGFAASLGRYLEIRRRYPDAEMMMGIGNLTELTDADSAGINVLLLGICQELGIRSVLTTEVINWARTSVRECDLARRLVYFALQQQVPPKHVEPRLVTLRDAKVLEYDDSFFEDLAQQLTDNNYRIFCKSGLVHLAAAGLHLSNRDPFVLFEELLSKNPGNIDASHAFYLGYEMAKAATANTLGKQYQQDEALDWGYLTELENRHRLKLTGRKRRSSNGPNESGSNAN